MNETIAEIQSREKKIREYEEQAAELENSARVLRRKREDEKLEVSRLRRIVNDSQIAQHVESSMKSAIEAEKNATASAASIKVTSEELKAMKAEFEATIAKLKKVIADAQSSQEPPLAEVQGD